jgi:tRNA 5-methylaminomethyl-2-thiouridine biosynthesis bifunctional protein
LSSCLTTLLPANGPNIISTSPLKNAVIVWDKAGLPFSPEYADIYFSVNDPVTESKCVFIEGSNLPERMAGLSNATLILCELGFGFGLNYLLTAEHFCRLAPPGSRLHYITCELHPVRTKDLQRFYAKLPTALLTLSAALLSNYPDLHRGLHRLQFTCRGRQIILDLVFEDAASAIAGLCLPHRGIDVWYLDGFTPTRNESMWQGLLFQEMATCSHAGTTLASYSVAGSVRRNLEAVGFRTEKSPGFGNKRHKLTGTFAGNRTAKPVSWNHPWPVTPVNIKNVAVIGAGLAGCSTAHSLSSRGITATLLEEQDEIAQASSGNPRGIVHFKPALGQSSAARFHLQAFTYALRHYQALASRFDFGWSASGVIQLAITDAEIAYQHKLLKVDHYTQAMIQPLSAAETVRLSGISTDAGISLMLAGGSLAPRDLCLAWVKDISVRLLTGTKVTGMQWDGSQWRLTLTSAQGRRKESFDAVVICNNRDALQLGRLPDYPVIANHGQTDTFSLASTTGLPKSVIGHKGYYIPWQDRGKPMATIGGSYAQGEHIQEISSAMTARNLALMEKIASGLGESLQQQQVAHAGRQQTRTTTPDYLPLAGPVEDTDACKRLFAGYIRNARRTILEQPAYQPGLYINIAHGSSGLTTTPLVAEYLASLIHGESLPLLCDDIQAIHPLRFLVKELKRQKNDWKTTGD